MEKQDQEYNAFIMKMETQDQEYKTFSAEEEAFRRGYTHGVIAAESGITLKEAYEWRHSSEDGCPPGTPGYGSNMFKNIK